MCPSALALTLCITQPMQAGMNDYPIVFVHGLMGWGRSEGLGLRYFGFAEAGVALGRLLRFDVRWQKRALFPSVGPISSHHDRACELFYRLKGGAVHYGKEHAAEHGHQESIEDWGDSGLYPQWDAEHPIHLVGHSQGAPTIRKLQELLARGDFFRVPGKRQQYSTSANWVRSLTSISGVLNGSLATYVLGCSMQDGTVQRYSAAEYAFRAMERLGAARGFGWDDFRTYVYDVDVEQWRAAKGKLDFGAFIRGKDNAAYDLSVHASQIFNDEVGEHPETYYLSYVTTQSEKKGSEGHHVPKPNMSPFMQPIAKEIGRFTAPLPNLRTPITDYADWWENDGLVSACAQDVPRGSTVHPHKHHRQGASLEPGLWNVMGRLDLDHVDIVTLPDIRPGAITNQVLFYRDLYDVLSSLE